MLPVQHGHGLHIAPVVGTGWLQVLLVVGTLAVVASALLRPFLPAPARDERLAVTGAAAVVVVLLLLGGGLDAPSQAAVAALAAAAVPPLAARHPGRPVAVFAGRAAPGVVVAAAAATGAELVRAALAPGDPAVLLRTAVLVGVVGLSWLVLCPSAPRVAAPVHALAWGLGNAVLAGTAALAVGGLPI